MGVLSRTLQAVQRLIDGEEPGADDEDRPQLGTSKRALHLLSVTSGSAKYQVVAETGDRAVTSLRLAGRAIEAPGDHEPTGALLSALEDLSAVAARLECEIEFRLPGHNGAVLAVIGPRTFDELARNAFIKGHSSVLGRIERVGGATKMHCGLRLPSQPDRMIVCRVRDGSLVRELGQHVYQTVVVSGEVTWLRNGMLVRTVVIEGVSLARKKSLVETANLLRKSVRGAWDRIQDPDKYLDELRRS